MTTATASGKIILFGEHAVVYGQPAIAVPVDQLRATTSIEACSGGTWIEAPGIDLSCPYIDLPSTHPIRKAIDDFANLTSISTDSIHIQIQSTIPVASGLGSGAAVSISLFRALSDHYQANLSSKQINELAFEIEKVHHGTPSGIDNTVIAFSTPVYFIKQKPIETFKVNSPLHFLIVDTGLSALTKVAVADVRKLFDQDPENIALIMDKIGQVVNLARKAIEFGDLIQLGKLMDQNQSLLEMLTVSCPELDHLIKIALENGALGAKLSGGGRGGNLIALVEPSNVAKISTALENAGAKSVLYSIVR